MKPLFTWRSWASAAPAELAARSREARMVLCWNARGAAAREARPKRARDYMNVASTELLRA